MIATHGIETVRFDLEIPERSKGDTIHQKVVRHFNLQFSSMLNEVFNRYGATEQIEIESLELQLDPIPYDQFEKRLLSACRRKLEAYFEKRKLQQTYAITPTSSAVEGVEGEKLQLLLHYLQYGRFPWSSNTLTSFARQWQEALLQPKFVHQIKSMRWTSRSIQRLSYLSLIHI